MSTVHRYIPRAFRPFPIRQATCYKQMVYYSSLYPSQKIFYLMHGCVRNSCPTVALEVGMGIQCNYGILLIQERNGFVVDNNEDSRVVTGVKVKVIGEVMGQCRTVVSIVFFGETSSFKLTSQMLQTTKAIASKISRNLP